MKKFITLFMLMGSVALNAESSQAESPEINGLRQSFLEAIYNEEGIYNIAAHLLDQANSQTSPDEIVERVKEMMEGPEFQQKLQSIFSAAFDDAEAKEAYELINNDLYKRYNGRLAQANHACSMATVSLFKQAIDETFQPRADIKAQADIPHLTKDNIQNILTTNKYVIIDAYADWCGPCKTFARTFAEVQQELGDQYFFVKMNVDDQPELSETYGITYIPTIIFIKNGQVLESTGPMTKKQFIAKIKNNFAEQ